MSENHRHGRATGLGLYVVWGLVVIGGAALQYVRWRTEATRAAQTQQALLQTQRDLARAKEALAGAVAVLGTYPTGPIFFEGRMAGSWAPVVDRVAGTRLVYFVDPSCGACAINYKVIAAMDTAFPHMVSVVTFSTDSIALETYAAGEAKALNVVQVTGGQLAHLIPRDGWPQTLVFRRDSLQTIVTGRLDSETVASVRQTLREAQRKVTTDDGGATGQRRRGG